MGGEAFFDIAEGESATDCFRKLVGEAQYDHGHSGYSGTIAEKGSFELVELKMGEGWTPSEMEDFVYDNPKTSEMEDFVYDNPKTQKYYNDKWGPAGCIEISPGKWLFFGQASS